MGPARLTSVRRGYAPHNNHFINPARSDNLSGGEA